MDSPILLGGVHPVIPALEYEGTSFKELLKLYAPSEQLLDEFGSFVRMHDAELFFDDWMASVTSEHLTNASAKIPDIRLKTFAQLWPKNLSPLGQAHFINYWSSLLHAEPSMFRKHVAKNSMFYVELVDLSHFALWDKRGNAPEWLAPHPTNESGRVWEIKTMITKPISPREFLKIIADLNAIIGRRPQHLHFFL